VVTGTLRGILEFRDARTLEVLATVRAHDSGNRSAINGVAFSPDGRRLVTASTDRTAKVFDVTKILGNKQEAERR
jgi:WD40 repeat protein